MLLMSTGATCVLTVRDRTEVYMVCYKLHQADTAFQSSRHLGCSWLVVSTPVVAGTSTCREWGCCGDFWLNDNELVLMFQCFSHF